MANEGFIFTNGMPRGRKPIAVTRREYLRQQLEDKPETAQMQRVKTLTRDERALAAIDRMTRDEIYDTQRAGGSACEERVRQDMAEVARVAELKRESRQRKK